jgi:hypothetical protein
MRDLLGRRSRGGRAVRFIAAVVLGILCTRALAALGVPRELRVIPVGTWVGCQVTLP